MKFIECNIENFGKLSLFKKTFKDGLNVVFEENGFGKTTFAAFLCAMFYGLDSGRSKDSDRNKYFPWQGGKFGGSITFTVSSKTYRLERFFGKKEKEDTFNLYNEETGMLSADYSENIGCELFGIDKRSYEKCCYIPQGKIDTDFSDSGDINAKLSNLLESDNDLASFDNAVDRLKKLESKFKRKGGEISETEGLKSELEDIIKYTEGLSDAENELKNKITEKKLLRKQLRDKIETIHKAAAKKEKAERYRALVLDVKESENKIKEITASLKSVPSEEEMSLLSELTEKYKKLLAIKEATLLTEEDKNKLSFYDQNIGNKQLSEQEYEEVKTDIRNYYSEKAIIESSKLNENEEKRLESLTLRFKESRPDDTELEKIYYNIRSAEEKAVTAPKKGSLVIPCIALTIIAALGAVLHFVARVNWGIAVSTVSIVCFLIHTFLWGAKRKKSEKAKLEKDALYKDVKVYFKNFCVNVDGSFEEAIREVKKMLTELYALEAKKRDSLNIENNSCIESIKKRLEEKTQRYLGECFTEETEQKFSELYRNLENYKRLKEKNALFVKTTTDADEAYIKLHEQSVKYTAKDADKAYNDILLAVTKLEEEKKNLEIKSDKLQEFIKVNGIPDDEIVEFSQRELLATNKAYDDLEETINELDSKLDKSIEKTEKLPEYKAELDTIEDELLALKKKLFIIENTILGLSKAKENLAAKYIGPLAEKFNKYRAILLNNDSFKLDIELKVGFSEHGEMHSSNALSSGLKDAVAIALRFALTDALFESEKPVVVLDDPFTNLDKQRIESAKNMLEAIASEYQIVYLTCHESRS